MITSCSFSSHRIKSQIARYCDKKRNQKIRDIVTEKFVLHHRESNCYLCGVVVEPDNDLLVGAERSNPRALLSYSS